MTLASERLPARVVADVFNLITIGDGIVGGSATIRYGVINQGVQQFEISLPAAWKNVEFTGPNIRRKEPTGNGTWLIGLQDKVWGGYTLVVTYDYPFDPKGASFAVGGIHALGVERETGSVALTTAASLKLTANSASDSLRRVDEMELSASDRALITRSVLLAYQYEEPGYKLDVEVKRFDEANVLSAVADRTQLTTVLTEAGEMLTQASFMVKNNDKQFQRFKLPTGSRFWNCHVNGQPVKAEQDGAWLMAPLPRGANRDQAFAVDIVYAEKKGVKPGWRSGAFTLEAPQTDVPNTYAEWQLFAPAVFRLSGFAGNMTPLRGTTYDFQEAWQRFTRFYWEFLHEAGPGLFMAGTLVLLLVALIASAIRRGVSGIITVLVVFSLVAILAAMLLPALARAKSRAQRISAVNNLKQIGLACRTWALDNGDRLPMSFEDMMNELGTDKVTYDPESGQRFVYMGGGQQFEQIQPDSIIAYSPTSDRGSRAVLMADGSVQQMSNARFDEMSRRGFIVPATAQQVAQNQQLAAVRSAQLQPATAQPAAVGAAPATPRVPSIRIDIPREGQAFTFTKVLNAGRVPLAVQLKIMKLQTFQTMQMSLQLGAFVSGLLLCWWQWRRARNTFLLTLGLALALGAVGNLLLAWRSLHLAFIWVTPLLLLAGLARLTWRFWPRPQPAQLRSTTGFEPGLPPAMAGIALLFFSTLMNGNLAAAQAKSAEDALAPKVSILSAAYIGTVNEHVAQLVATLRVSSSQPGQKVFLFGEDVAVQQLSAHPRDVRLERDGKGVAVTLGHRGEANLRLQLLVKLGGDVTRRQLAFAIPPALSSSLALTIEQPEAVVEFPAAIALKRATANQQTQVEAVIGSAERVELRWTPRVKRAAEIAANVICRNSTLVRFAGGALNARAQFDYQVTQGEMRHARVRLPAGHRLLRVEGEAIRTWDLKTENGDQNVLVELLKGIAPNYRLTIETEKPLEKLPALMQAEIPHALDVKRETGLLALQGDEELELAVENSSELVRVDVEEFGRSIAQKPEAALNAFRFLKPDFSLQVRVGVMQPEVEAVLRNFLRVGQDQVSLSATVDYTVKRAGLFGLKLVLPDGYRLETVSGTNILQWAERQETGRRFLEISLKERTAGSYPLRLNLVRNLNELPKTLPIAGVHPLGTQKLTGFVSVSVEPGVGIKPEASEGLTEIPAGTLTGGDAASGSAVLAYKFIAGAPQPAPAWTLAVQTEAVESWVRAEIVNTLTVADTLVSGRAVARFEIQNAPVKELRFRIPARFKNVEISGANIRRRDHDGEKWTVEFQSKIRGAHILNVTWEEPRRLGTSQAELEGVAADGVERETGLLAVIARPPLQVTGQQPGDLQPIDLRELPDWAGQPDEATVLAYRYLRPGYKLAVEAKRFNEAEALQALVESLLISTVVAEDGQMMTQLTLSVRNQGRQHLEIALPSGVTNVWSAFVAGQPVRPGIKEGKLLLPLEQSVGDDAPVTIEVVYVGSSRFPQNRGPIDLISPRLDAPLKSARWELFLPMDYTYSGFSGTMAHEVEAALADPSSFSYLDYSSRESKNKAELAKELKSELISAKKKLSSGNVKEALADYNRARAKGDLSTTRDDDTKQLEADLRRAQGSNLIEAQNAFSLSNGAQPGQRQHPVGGQQATQYDAAAAEAQWTKLQQAQEIGRAKVQPIRVTLPTRGLRHSFTQVLQTEPGKELTIHLVAANAHTVSWPKRIIGPAASFLALWVVVALIARRRTAASSPAVA